MINSTKKTLEKLSFIYKLIISSPRYKLIILLQLVSGLASIVGLPLLLPVLSYMEGNSSPAGQEKYFQFIELVLSKIGLEPNFYLILTIAAFFILFGQILVFISTLLAANAQVEISEKYKKEIFDAYSKADWLWLIDNRSGEMNYSVLNEADTAGVAHLNAQRVFIYLLQVGVLLFITVKLSFLITFLAVVVYGILAILSSLSSAAIHRLSEIYNDKYKKLANDLNGLQQNKKFFKTSLLNRKSVEGIFSHISDIAFNIKKQNIRIEMQRTLSLFVTFVFLISLMFFYKQLSLNYSTLLLVLLIFVRIAPQFSMLSAAFASLDSNIPIYCSLHKRLEEFHSNEEKNGSEGFQSSESINFDNVSYSYPNGNKVFDGLNVVIEPKKATAFVGCSGVGKSTLLDLTLRLLNPTQGTIFYGDIPHDRLDKDSLRSKVAYVSQETTLVDGTLKDNLTIRVSDYTDEKIWKVIKKAGLEEVVNGLAQGIDTPIGENGIQLSGGQRQRVALARALFMDPEILILDEATSSLDVQSDLLIQETIKNLKKDFTIIIVTHKISSVKFADMICVLENGKACEVGSYSELQAKKGKFHQLETLQKEPIYMK
ncbi:MAG: ABC transporter ATP-binding protein [Candidatus Omnitrophica bacterium]|nr:ABC transporter ATP-binding protein [Candidatus Omnitrophota bacterium]